MKQLLLTTALCLLCMASTWAQQYDFTAESGTNTLYYKITDNDAKTVAVVSELVPSNDNGWRSYGYATAPTGALIIPETVTYNGVEYNVTSIGNNAFFICKNLTGTLTIPNGVVTIGVSAFSGCSGLTDIESLATTPPTAYNSFYSITHLSVKVADADAAAAYKAAEGWKDFTNYIYGDSYYTITYNANDGKSTTSAQMANQGESITIAENTFTYRKNVFLGWATTPDATEAAYTAGDEFTPTGDITLYAVWKINVFSAESGDNTLYFEITDADAKTVAVISENDNFPFYTTYPTGTLTIPETVTYNEVEYSVTSIGKNAFYDCTGLSSGLTIPNSVESIGYGAFQNCSGFTGTLTIPNSMVTIGDYSFAGCRDLTAIYNYATTPQVIEANVFDGVTIGDIALYVPAEAISTYEGAAVWQDFKDVRDIANAPKPGEAVEGDKFSAESDGNTLFFEITDAYTKEVAVVSEFGGWNNNYTISPTGKLIIPETVTHNEVEYSVTSIGNNAFSFCTNLSDTLTIPDSVMSIGDFAFFGCRGLTGSLIIGNSVETIGRSAFQNCSGFTAIYNYATTPQVIDANVFNGIEIGNIYLLVPAEAISAYEGAAVWQDFKDVIDIEDAPKPGEALEGDKFSAESEDNTLYFKITDAYTKEVAVISENNRWPYYTTSPTGTLIIPEKVTYKEVEYTVTSIGDLAFEFCSGLTGSLTIPANITSIGDYAFHYCSGFTGSLTIPANITSIGQNAFYGCSGLTGIEPLATTPLTANNNSFNGITHLSVIVPDADAATTYKAAEGWKEFTNYVYGDSYYTITYNANGAEGTTAPQMANQGESISIAENAFTYRKNVFLGWATTPNATEAEYTAGYEFTPTGDITLYAVWEINIFTAVCDENTLYFEITNADAKEVAVVSELENYPYNTTSPTGVLTIPETVTHNEVDYTVTSIGNRAFYWCDGLTGSLTIPANITSIGQNAFYGCNGVTSVEPLATTPSTADYSSFGGITHLSVIVANADAAATYKAAEGWKDFTNYVYGDSYYTITYNANGGEGTIAPQMVMPGETLNLNMNRFYRDGYLFLGWATTADATEAEYAEGDEFTPTKNITLYAVWSEIFTVNTAEGYALKYAVILGTETVTLIGMDKDVKAPGEDNLVIPASVTYNSTAYRVTNIRAYAFKGCSGFTGTLTIPNGVTSIGIWAFSCCSGFTGNLTIPNNMVSIEDYAFDACSGFTGNLTIPDGVTSIKSYAFNYCTGLSGSLTIPNSVQRIEDYAFAGCRDLTAIYNYATTPQVIVANVFNDVTIGNINLYVPKDVITSYEGAAVWQDFGSTLAIIEVPANIEHAQVQAAPFTQVGNTLYFSEPTKIAIYNVSGIMLYSGEVTEYTLPNRIGVYVVCAEVGSYKVLSR